MRKLIILSSIALFISTTAFAGPDPTANLYLDETTKCGVVHDNGDRFLRSGETCQVNLYFTTSYYPFPKRPIRYWLEKKEIGERNYKRFRHTNTFYPNPRKSAYSANLKARFKFTETAQYTLCVDYNNNGFAEDCSNSIWLFRNK